MATGGGRDGKGWDRLKKILDGFEERLRQNARKMLARAGQELASDIRGRILDGKGMKKLHPFTIAQKKSSKPLIDGGDLLGSVGAEFVEELAVLVGVNRKAADGTNLGALHEREEGTRVPVSPKMRGFLAARGLHLKGTTKELFIPGRPFLRPAYKDFRDRKSAEGLAVELVEKTLAGKG